MSSGKVECMATPIPQSSQVEGAPSAAAALARVVEIPWTLFPGLGGRPLLTQHAVVLLGRDQEFPTAKAKADFGFAPVISLREGLGRSAEWLSGLET